MFRPLQRWTGGGLRHRPAGNVRIVDHQFVDDTGPFTPIGDTLFVPVWMAQHDPAMLDRELNLVQGDYIRIFGEVSGSSWSDRTVDPFDPYYETHLGEALEAGWERGIRTMLTIFASGLIQSNRLDEVVDHVLNVCVPRQLMLQAIEIANEDNFTGSDADLRRIAKKLSDMMPGIPIMPHSGVMGTFDDVCNADSEHFERTDGDNGWRVVRQPFDTNLRVAGGQGEPAGIHLHQNEDVHDAVRMAFMWLVGIVSRFPLFTVHTGAGVRSGGAYDQGMGRPASFGDPQMADYPAYMAKCRELAALLPQGVGNWARTSQSGSSPRPDNFLWSDTIWSDGADHGVSRCYVNYSGNSFVALVFGVLHYADMHNSRAISATVYDAYSGLSQGISVSAGQGFRLNGSPTTDAAYVIVGTKA